MNVEDVFTDSIDYPGNVLYNITVESREGPLKFRLILEDIDYDYDDRVREFIQVSFSTTKQLFKSLPEVIDFLQEYGGIERRDLDELKLNMQKFFKNYSTSEKEELEKLSERIASKEGQTKLEGVE